MNTTPKTPLALLAEAADELHALTDRLTDAAEELLREPTPAPVALPTVDVIGETIWRASLYDGGAISVTGAEVIARAVLDLIAERVPVWKPVEPDQIRPGMRVRRVTTDGTENTFTVGEVTDERVYFKGGYVWVGVGEGVWFVDPRTVPAEPEDPRVEVLAEEMEAEYPHCDDEWPCAGAERFRGAARRAIARLDAVDALDGEADR